MQPIDFVDFFPGNFGWVLYAVWVENPKFNVHFNYGGILLKNDKLK